jgi:hypothetical protein
MSTIIYIGGDKGGVGKSLVAIALCDYVKHTLGTPVLLIETDSSNPDAGRCLEQEMDTVVQADTATEEGWISLLNAIEAGCHTTTAVINAGARDNIAMKEFGTRLSDGASGLEANLIIAWVINAERDSLIALRDFLNFYEGDCKIFVIGNQYFDKDGAFTLYQSSEVRKEIEQRGGGELLRFPVLPKVLAAEMKNNRRSPQVLKKEGLLFDRVCIDQWRKGTAAVFQKMLG